MKKQDRMKTTSEAINGNNEELSFTTSFKMTTQEVFGSNSSLDNTKLQSDNHYLDMHIVGS